MGKRERERSCQAVYPCHNSQKSAMDEWITAISGCQGKSSVRFDVLMGAWWLSRNRIYKSSHVDANFSPTYFPSACKWIAFAVAEIFNLSVTEMLFIVDTQARTNSLCGHVDRVSELWLQAYSVCVCCCF